MLWQSTLEVSTGNRRLCRHCSHRRDLQGRMDITESQDQRKFPATVSQLACQKQAAPTSACPMQPGCFSPPLSRWSTPVPLHGHLTHICAWGTDPPVSRVQCPDVHGDKCWDAALVSRANRSHPCLTEHKHANKAVTTHGRVSGRHCRPQLRGWGKRVPQLGPATGSL